VLRSRRTFFAVQVELVIATIGLNVCILLQHQKQFLSLDERKNESKSDLKLHDLKEEFRKFL